MTIHFHPLAQEIGALFLAKKLLLATAESCTGGQVAEIITTIPGSSQWFERGFVTYSNAAKHEMLGVKEVTLAQFGAVSGETAKQMAEGALKHSHADVSLAVTGIAGPDGGTPEKPVGTIWFAWAGKTFVTQIHSQLFTGSRIQIRDQATFYVVDELIKILNLFL